MAKPNDWGQEYVEMALAGDPGKLFMAFAWDMTPQGWDFWHAEAKGPELSPEAREILVNWSNEK